MFYMPCLTRSFNKTYFLYNILEDTSEWIFLFLRDSLLSLTKLPLNSGEDNSEYGKILLVVNENYFSGRVKLSKC